MILKVNKRKLFIGIGFVCSLLFAMLVESKLLLLQKETFKVYPYVPLIGWFYIPAGCFLGLVSRGYHANNGKWHFNLKHFLLFCIPSIYMLLYSWLHFVPFLSLPEPFGSTMLITGPYPLFGLILGFGIVTSFPKKESV